MSHMIKVLMADDEEQFRATTKKILNGRGFETILAASGEEALAQLRVKPDVVVLDVKMPGINGHQTLKKIKKQVPDLPVIMLTGHRAVPSAREVLVEGAFDYLSKPCDIDLLSAKITDAYYLRKKGEPPEEKSIMEVMVPIMEYTKLDEEQSTKDAIKELKESFASKISTSRIMETGHRSVFVMDDEGNVQGMLAITDLLECVMPAYLSAPKPSTADSIQYSPMFWKGMFTKEIKGLFKKKIREIMSPAPFTIDGRSTLMEAAYMMVINNARRLVVVMEERAVGVIREQDLFLEMDRIRMDL